MRLRHCCRSPGILGEVRVLMSTRMTRAPGVRSGAGGPIPLAACSKYWVIAKLKLRHLVRVMRRHVN